MENVEKEKYKLVNIKINGIEYEAELITFYDLPLEYYIPKNKIYLRFFKEENTNVNGIIHLYILIENRVDFDYNYNLKEEELLKLNHKIVTNYEHVDNFNLYFKHI